MSTHALSHSAYLTFAYRRRIVLGNAPRIHEERRDEDMQSGRELLYLSCADVEKACPPMREIIDILEHAHTLKGEGRIAMPAKPVLGNPAEGFSAAYVAEIPDMGSQGVKWLSGVPGNPGRGLPAITGLVILNDPETRMPVAVMDGTYLTRMRTAGISGIGLRRLANPRSEVVAVLGLGLQGRTNLEAAMTELSNVSLVRAWSPQKETRRRYVLEMTEKYPNIIVEEASSAEYAVRDADILLSSTPFGKYGSFKIIERDWLKIGLTAVPVSQDAHFLPAALMGFDKYYIDDRAMFDHMACSKQISMPTWELSQYLTGRAPGREDPKERILLLTEGIAINDVSVAQHIYKRALEKGIGMLLPI